MDWMSLNGFIFGEDFKSIEKVENDPEKKYAKVQMKETTFKSVNGLEFGDKKVQFVPHK